MIYSCITKLDSSSHRPETYCWMLLYWLTMKLWMRRRRWWSVLTARDSPISFDRRESSPPPIKLLKLLGYVKKNWQLYQDSGYLWWWRLYGYNNIIMCYRSRWVLSLALIRSSIVLCGRRPIIICQVMCHLDNTILWQILDILFFLAINFQAEKNTAEAYVDLAICLGGATWAIRILRESSLTKNVTLQESFTSSLIQIKLREIRTVIESCRM